jgi:hypothetical protein
MLTTNVSMSLHSGTHQDLQGIILTAQVQSLCDDPIVLMKVMLNGCWLSGQRMLPDDKGAARLNEALQGRSKCSDWQKNNANSQLPLLSTIKSRVSVLFSTGKRT